MRDPRPAADPVLNPLLERLAFLETANDGLKSKLSAGGFSAEIQNLALRDQLESARAEAARQQDALESFYREALAAGRENDALRKRVETLEAGLESARRGATDEGVQGRVRELEAQLEAARRDAREAENALRGSLQKAEAAATERLRALAAEFAERETSLLQKSESDGRRLAALELELERALRGAQDAQSALRESSRQTDADTAERLRALTKELADRETARLQADEKGRQLLEAMERRHEHDRLDAQDSARALRESHQKAQAEAEERLQKSMTTFAEREGALLKAGERDRRLLAETAGELERSRVDAREAQRRAAAASELEAELHKKAEDERRRREALEFELARRDALESDRIFRESQRKSLPVVQAEAAERLRARETEFAERETRLIAEGEDARRRVAELERAALEARQESERTTQAKTEERLRGIAKEFSEREALLLKTAESDRNLVAELSSELEKTRRGLQQTQAEAAELEASLLKKTEDVRALEEKPEPEAESAPEPFVSPALEPLLEPGWARLLRLVRPPVDSAYAHLRRLSATALTTGQKTLLRMAAASIASASDSLSSIELALEEGPAPGAASTVLPVLESSVAAWEAAFRGRGVALVREFSSSLPEAAHDPKELRIALHHVLRNALEAVPRGGHLTFRAGRGPDAELRLEFSDDGPGFSAQWLERRFEPFAAPRRGRAGLGLSLVRRTLRRWGGDAEAANAPSGRGARLTLIFAPPPPPAPAAK